MNPEGYTTSSVKSLIQGKSRDLSGMEKSLIIKASSVLELRDKGRTDKSQAEFDFAMEIKLYKEKEVKKEEERTHRDRGADEM